MKRRLLVAMLLCLGSLVVMVGCEPPDDVNDQVVIVGDSIFALSGEIANELERLSGEQYRDYSVSGASWMAEW